MSRPTVARIDLNAVMYNAQLVRDLVGERKIIAAVKADAYGHGAAAIAHALSLAGVDMFGVAMTEEAVDLREAGITRPILVLSAVPPEDIDALLDYGVMASVAGEGFARALSERAQERGSIADVHVNIDTGMRRQGFDWQTAAVAILSMAKMEGLRIAGVFSHFACSGDRDLAFSREQVRRFRSVLDQLRQAGMPPPLAHMANSDGVLRMRDAYFDGVRPGLMLYGMLSRSSLRAVADVRPVLSLRTRIAFCKALSGGEKISYGRTYTLWRDSVIATLPIGYYDGYDRRLGNTGEVLVRGRRVPVVGRVCMDQTLVDVTDVPGAQVGDEVVLYGRQGDESIRIEEMGYLGNMIPYELTCSIGRRVRREYVLNGAAVAVVPPRSVVANDAVGRIFGVGAKSDDGSGEHSAGYRAR